MLLLKYWQRMTRQMQYVKVTLTQIKEMIVTIKILLTILMQRKIILLQQMLQQYK